MFHLLFILWFPQGKIFWKRVDYWWVSFGVIGIIGSTFTFRKENSHSWQPFHKNSLSAVFDEYQKDLRYEALKFSDSGSYVTNIFPDSTKRNMVLQLGDSLMQLSRKVDSCRLLITEKEHYELVDSLIEPCIRYDEIIDRIAGIKIANLPKFWGGRIHEESKMLIELKKKEDRDNLNWLILLFSPYFFAIAMAIRLTKVTAEIKELRSKS